MLQNLRERAASWTVRVVLVLVALSFVFWGTSSIFNLFLEDEVVASINDEEISLHYYQNAVNAERERLQGDRGTDALLTRVNEKDLQDRVLSQLINRTLVSQVAIEDKITLSQEQIDQIIVNQPFFHRDGKFDERGYLAAIRRAGFSPQGYRRYILDNFQRETYLTAVRDATFYTRDMLDQYVDWQYQKRHYSYLHLPVDSFVEEQAIGEEQLRNFYAENVDDYYEPDYFRINSILITPDKAITKISYDEQDIRSTYRDLYGYLYDAQLIGIRHIFFESPDASDDTFMVQAEELKKEINNRDDFVRLVEQWSQDTLTKGDGGILGEIPATELPPEFLEAVRASSDNPLGPLRTPFGVHLLWVDNRSAINAPTFEEAYDELVTDYIYNQLDETLLSEAEAIADELFVNPDLDQVADITGYELETSDLITLDSDYVQSLGQEFIDELLLLEEGDVSNVIWLDDGNFMAFQLIEFKPERLVPYGEIELELRRDYLLAQAAARLQSLLPAKLAELNQGLVSPTELASQFGDRQSWQGQQEISQIEQRDDEIANYVLSMPTGRLPYAGYTKLANEDYAVVYLEEISHKGYDDLDEAAQSAIEENYLLEMRKRAEQWLLTNLNAKADIVINTEILGNL